MLKKYKKLISCSILLVIFVIITLIIKNYFKPFFVIIILVLIGEPVNKIFKEKLFFSRRISALLTLILINSALFVSIFFIGNFLVDKIGIVLTKDIYNLISSINMWLEKIEAIINIEIMRQDLYVPIRNLSTILLRKSAVYTTEGFMSYVIGNITAYFVLLDKKYISIIIEKLIHENNYNLIMSKYDDVKKLMKIEVFMVIIVTIETIFGLYALNIKDAFVLGVISGVLDIMPYVGNVFVFIPLILVKLIEKNYIIAFGLICLYFMLIISRQVLETKFMSKNLKIHPLPLILSLYLGFKIFGVIGMIIGPIYVITAKEIILSS